MQACTFIDDLIWYKTAFEYIYSLVLDVLFFYILNSVLVVDTDKVMEGLMRIRLDSCSCRYLGILRISPTKT